jgi:hypothetical protein
VANKVRDCSDVMLHVLGKGQGLTYQPGDTLPQSIVKALNKVGFSGLLGDGVVLFCQSAWVLGNQMVFSIPNELSATILAAMVLFAVMSVAISLEVLGSRRWTRVSLDHSCPPWYR